MNLLSDLSNELAMAILVEKKHAEKFKKTDGVNLIGKVREILQPISADKIIEKKFSKPEKSESASH